MDSNYEQIEKLASMIQFHNKKYWEDNNPIISDIEYDNLVQELKKLHPKHPILQQRNQPNIKNKAVKVTHPFKLYSQDKIYSYEELLKWMKKVSRNENEYFSIQLKYDGWSGYILNGKIYTGGDGTTGFDITYKSNLIKPIQNSVEHNKELGNFIHEKNIDITQNPEIPKIGEFILTKSNFQKYKSKIVRKNGQEYKTERSALSGILGSDEFEYDIKDLLNFVIYHDLDGFVCSLNEFIKIQESGFNKLITNIKTFYNNYPSDGLVIKLLDKTHSEFLGYTSDFPRGQIAYKFGNPKGQTILKNIKWEMGKNSTINPIGIVEPVIIEGHTITKVNLHNLDQIEKLNLNIDDLVEIERCGMIIPNITKVIKSNNNNKIIYPSKCPICNSNTYRAGPFLYCTNNEFCLGSLSKIIEDSCKRLGIENLARATINKLIEKKLINNICDIFDLDIDSFMELDGFQEKSSENLYNEIQKALSVNYPDWKLLSALNINTIGDSLSKEVMKKYTFEELSVIEDPEQLEIPNFGPERKKILIDGFIDKFNILSCLRDTLIYYDTKYINNNITKLKICFSGKMPSPRSHYEKMAEEKGYEVVKSVTKDLDILVSEESNSSKTKKAQKLGIKVISLQLFLELINK